MLKCDDLALIEELLQQVVANSGKPSYAFGVGGNAPAGTWLNTHGRPSNKVGVPFGLNNGLLIDLWVGNESLVAYDVGLYYHYGDEVGLTLLTTVSVTAAARTATFTVSDFGTVAVPTDCQIAAKIESVVTTSPKNPGIHATITGTT
jgi:hypothetical protein